MHPNAGHGFMFCGHYILRKLEILFGGFSEPGGIKRYILTSTTVRKRSNKGVYCLIIALGE